MIDAGPPPSNELVLSARDSQRLVSYASHVRECLARSGVRMGTLPVTPKLIAFAVRDGRSPRSIVDGAIICTRAVGPPRGASLQAFADRVVLYVPKQCLLDVDDAQAGPRSSSSA